MAADRVLHDLDQRLHVLIEGLRAEAGQSDSSARSACASWSTSSGCSMPLSSLRAAKALEVGALAAGDVDDLDVLAGPDDIGLGRRAVDADILQGSASGSGRGVSFG